MINFQLIGRCTSLLINNYRNVIQQRFLHNCTHINFANGLIITNHNVSFLQCRSYAKGKDKKKDKGKGKVQIKESQLSEVINVELMKNEMQKSLENLKSNYMKHVSLRSAAGSIESIQVKVDGKEHTLQEIAQIVRKNPKLIVINMAVFPQAIPAALQAISKSGLNLNPQQEGNTLYIPVPKVTKEHRQELLKNAKALFIKCRDGIKDVQNRNTKALKKNETLSKDVIHLTEQQIVAMADTYVAQAEQILDSKQMELTGGE